MASKLNRYLRAHQIIGCTRRNPPVSPLIPISKSTLWLWVKEGKFPRGKKLSPRCTVWSEVEVMQFIANLEEPANDC